MNTRHKTHKQENFSVGLLVAKKHHAAIMELYHQARFYDDIADNPALSSDEKLKILNQEKSDNTYLEDIKKALKQDAQGFTYQTWQDLLNYCNYSAAPVGRFFLHIHNEKPNLKADTLCAIMQIANHLQDLKYDARTLNRIYIPRDFLSKYGIDESELYKDQTSPELKKVITDILHILKLMLQDCSQLPNEIKSLRLRMEVCVIISLTTIMLKRIESGDVLAQNIKLNRFDWLKSIIVGIIKGLIPLRRRGAP